MYTNCAVGGTYIYIKERWIKTHINYGNIWDATKGYRGEGPEEGTPRGKKNGRAQDRGDNRWMHTLQPWEEATIDKETTELWHKGDDLWYTESPEVTWDTLETTAVTLNIAGWGREQDRIPLWNFLHNSKTSVVAIIDHKNTLTGINNIEYEMSKHWVKLKEKPKFSHAAAANRHIGGITLAIHPCLGRYAQPTNLTEDPRGWGRWTGIALKGKNKTLYIIATYGPTPNENEDAKESMWQKQIKAMQKIPIYDKEKDPKHQYIADLQKILEKINCKENTSILILGDMNIDPRQDTEPATKWKNMTESTDLTHTTLNRWPSLTSKLNTWNNKLLDHIYISRNSAAHVTAAGIETGKITYKSDHNMVGTRIKFSKILGRTKNSNERYQPPKRILKYADKEKVELYKKYIKK